VHNPWESAEICLSELVGRCAKIMIVGVVGILRTVKREGGQSINSSAMDEALCLNKRPSLRLRPNRND